MPDARAPSRAAPACPVRFNDVWWRRDLIASDPRGRAVARRARTRFEREGVASGELEACLPEGPEGSRLPICVKAYLGMPRSDLPYGIVFVGDLVDQRIVLRHLAFGGRHPRRGIESVYQVASRRLNG